MAGTEFLLEGKWAEYCSCDWGCPCESNSPPTRGHCTGLVAFKIDKGHCGDVKLDDLAVAATFYFPRALHHGGGSMQPIVDERATAEQREAIFYVLSGKDQSVGTMFQIFSVIIEKILDPLFMPITFKWDIDNRSAEVTIPGLARATSTPILNPVTDKVHRMVTVMPDAWVFYEAENVSGAAKSLSGIRFDFSQRHSSLATYAWNQNGMAYSQPEHKRRFGSRV